MTEPRGDEGVNRDGPVPALPTRILEVAAVAAEGAAHPEDPGAGLLARYLGGEAAAFEALVRHYQGPIYGYFRRSGVGPEVADELFQETFLRVHLHGASYQPVRPFRVWLYTVANNLLRSHFRKRKVRRILVDWWFGGGGGDTDRAFDPPSPGPAPDDHAASRETLRWLEGALPNLPDGPRQALLLTQVDGLAVAEAALVLGVPEATVKTWVRRARIGLADARHRDGGLA